MELRTTSFIETTGIAYPGSRVRQTPEEGRRTYRPKRCGNNNKDEDNSPKNLNDKKQNVLPVNLIMDEMVVTGCMEYRFVGTRLKCTSVIRD